jgi:hypothetical protein
LAGPGAPMKRAASGAPPFFLGMKFDRSAWALIAANLFAMAVAYATGMGLREMLFVYWMQSVIIGICAVIRILNLKSFSTKDFSMTGGPVEETPAGKRKAAISFTLIYGTMHVGYLFFLYFGGPSIDRVQGSLLGYGLCAAAFAVNHAYSLHKNMRADTEGRPNLGNLMMLPFARIVPMHFTVVVGNAMASGIAATFFFLIFKTFMDVILHCIEHSALRSVRPGEPHIS